MRLLLISNSTNFGENYLAWASTQIEFFCLQNHITKESRIIFVPFAGVNIGGKAYPESYDAYEAKVKDVFLRKFGLENPIYGPTAAYGHMGRKPYVAPVQVRRDGQTVTRDVQFFGWELLDAVPSVKTAFGL